jgi:hypothetical protein
VSDYGLDDRGSIPSRVERIFPLASVSRPALGQTQPPVKWVPGVLSPGVKRGVKRTTHRHPVLRSWMSTSYSSSPPKRLRGVAWPVWTQRLEEKYFWLCWGSNLDRPVVQSIARHYTDWATRAPHKNWYATQYNGQDSGTKMSWRLPHTVQTAHAGSRGSSLFRGENVLLTSTRLLSPRPIGLHAILPVNQVKTSLHTLCHFNLRTNLLYEQMKRRISHAMTTVYLFSLFSRR